MAFVAIFTILSISYFIAFLVKIKQFNKAKEESFLTALQQVRNETNRNNSNYLYPQNIKINIITGDNKKMMMINLK